MLSIRDAVLVRSCVDDAGLPVAGCCTQRGASRVAHMVRILRVQGCNACWAHMHERHACRDHIQLSVPRSAGRPVKL